LDGIKKSYQDQMLHLNGEMDLPLHLPYTVARGVANHCAECCGHAARWNDVERTITTYLGDKAYRVWYAEEGGITDVKDITIETQIEDLEAWNDTWYRRIRGIELLGVDPHDKRTAADYMVYINANKRKIAELKEKLNVQNGNS
jgi:hypothetical protein